EEAEEGRPGRRNVDVEDALHDALVALGRYDQKDQVERQHHRRAGEPGEQERSEVLEALGEHGGRLYSCSTCSNKSHPATVKTTSKARSTRTQIPASPTPPSSTVDALTAAISNGTSTGKISSGRMTSRTRVPTEIEAKSVASAAKPRLPSRQTSARPNGRTGTIPKKT